jgi:hypothetical protein
VVIISTLKSLWQVHVQSPRYSKSTWHTCICMMWDGSWLEKLTCQPAHQEQFISILITCIGYIKLWFDCVEWVCMPSQAYWSWLSSHIVWFDKQKTKNRSVQLFMQSAVTALFPFLKGRSGFAWLPLGWVVSQWYPSLQVILNLNKVGVQLIS